MEIKKLGDNERSFVDEKDNNKYSSNKCRYIFVITTKDRACELYERFNSKNLRYERLAGISIADNAEYSFKDLRVVSKEKISDFITREVIDEVFIDLDSKTYNINEFISELECIGVDISIRANEAEIFIGKDIKKRLIGDMEVVTYSKNTFKSYQLTAVRLLDIIGALVGLVIFGIASIILVPLIRKDGGPAIFAQTRVGKNGRYFKIYKFRSMCINAEDIKKDLSEYNMMTGNMFKMENDPRITKIGKFIREHSLDELPQFLNVLRGDMSLVGTRPPTIDEYKEYTPAQKKRLSFKVGITGLWQVSGRNRIRNFDEIVKLDNTYIDNWTILEDIKIIIRTIKVVLKKDGAR